VTIGGASEVVEGREWLDWTESDSSLKRILKIWMGRCGKCCA